MDSITSPDNLNDYIRVSTPGVWIVLTAVVVLLIGVLVWSVFGTVKMKDPSGRVEEIHPITFVVN